MENKLDNINGMITILLEKLDEFQVEDNYMYDIDDESILSENLFTLAGARIIEKLSVDIKLKELDDLYNGLIQNLDFFNWTINELLKPELEKLKKVLDEDDLEDTLDEVEFLEGQIKDIEDIYKIRYAMLKEAILKNEICTIGDFE